MLLKTLELINLYKRNTGLTDDYIKGFDKMYKDNFFGTKGKDVKNDYILLIKLIYSINLQKD